MSTQPTGDEWSSSGDTSVRFVPGAYHIRDRWWSRKRRVEGVFVATHAAWPGAWGGGATEQEALDELCSVIRCMAAL